MRSIKKISPDEIALAVAATTKDPSLKRGKFFYYSIIRDCLDELSVSALWNDVTRSFPLGEKLEAELPETLIDLLGVWVHEQEECTPLGLKNVFWKQGADIVNGELVARNRDGINDIFHKYTRYNESMLFYVVSEGKIKFSKSCRGHSWFSIQYTESLDPREGNLKIIPAVLKQGIVDYCAWKVVQMKRSELQRSYGPLYQEISFRAFGREMSPDSNSGTWAQAVTRALRMNSAERRDLNNAMQQRNLH